MVRQEVGWSLRSFRGSLVMMGRIQGWPKHHNTKEKASASVRRATTKSGHPQQFFIRTKILSQKNHCQHLKTRIFHKISHRNFNAVLFG